MKNVMLWRIVAICRSIRKEKGMKLLNIYGQAFYHQEARIIGNREGLEALKQTIDDALRVFEEKASTNDNKEPLFASDGEGYEVIVEMNNDEWGLKGGKDSFWNKEESHPEYTSLLGQRSRE